MNWYHLFFKMEVGGRGEGGGKEEERLILVASMIRDLLPEHTISHPVIGQFSITCRVKVLLQTPELFHATIF
jgi:hypothetical protein